MEFDKNHTDTLGIMHEDYDKRAIYKFIIDIKLMDAINVSASGRKETLVLHLDLALEIFD